MCACVCVCVCVCLFVCLFVGLSVFLSFCVSFFFVCLVVRLFLCFRANDSANARAQAQYYNHADGSVRRDFSEDPTRSESLNLTITQNNRPFKDLYKEIIIRNPKT